MWFDQSSIHSSLSVSNFSFLDVYSSFLTLSDMTISQKTFSDKHDILTIQIRVAGKKSITYYSYDPTWLLTTSSWRDVFEEDWYHDVTDLIFTLSDEHLLLISARSLSLWSASHFRWYLFIFLSSTLPLQTDFDVLRRNKSKEDTDRYTHRYLTFQS